MLNANNSLLLVDDIFDSGRSIEAAINTIKSKMRLNTPSNIKVATVLYKPQNNKTDITPDYYVGETDKWVVFPHEVEEMNVDEIEVAKGSKIAKIIKDGIERETKRRQLTHNNCIDKMT